MAHEFTFQELIQRKANNVGFQFDVERSRLLRHNAEARVAWGHGSPVFDHYVSFQAAPPQVSLQSV